MKIKGSTKSSSRLILRFSLVVNLYNSKRLKKYWLLAVLKLNLTLSDINPFGSFHKCPIYSILFYPWDNTSNVPCVQFESIKVSPGWELMKMLIVMFFEPWIKNKPQIEEDLGQFTRVQAASRKYIDPVCGQSSLKSLLRKRLGPKPKHSG